MNRLNWKGIKAACVAGLASLAVSGCVTYGQQGFNDGYIDDFAYYDTLCDPYSPYENYADCDFNNGFANIGFTGGYFDNFFYPGFGLFVFDNFGQQFAIPQRHRGHWARQRHAYRQGFLGRNVNRARRAARNQGVAAPGFRRGRGQGGADALTPAQRAERRDIRRGRNGQLAPAQRAERRERRAERRGAASSAGSESNARPARAVRAPRNGVGRTASRALQRQGEATRNNRGQADAAPARSGANAATRPVRNAAPKPSSRPARASKPAQATSKPSRPARAAPTRSRPSPNTSGSRSYQPRGRRNPR